MEKDRLTAFADGVIAIIITIMVLELKCAARSDASGPARCDPDFPRLRTQLRLCRDVLEQSPPLFPPCSSGEWGNSLQVPIIRSQGRNSSLARAIGRGHKGKLSPPLYLLGIATAFVDPRISEGIYVLVALMWLVPDRRVERMLASRSGSP